MPALTDPRAWTTTKEEQEAGIDLVAGLIDAAVKEGTQRGAHWQDLKKLIAASPRVQEHSLEGCREDI